MRGGQYLLPLSAVPRVSPRRAVPAITAEDEGEDEVGAAPAFAAGLALARTFAAMPSYG
jgi:hypothetical protein